MLGRSVSCLIGVAESQDDGVVHVMSVGPRPRASGLKHEGLML
jgi:hypothetical protein